MNKIMMIVFLSLISNILYSQNCNTKFKIIVRPYTDKPYSASTLPLNELNFKIVNFDMAQKVCDSFIRYNKNIELISNNGNIKKIIEMISDSVKQETFIKKVDTLLNDSSALFLFSSIDVNDTYVVLRAEIVDSSAKLKAFATREIERDLFKLDKSGNNEINDLVDDLICQLTGCGNTVGFIAIENYLKNSCNLKYGIGVGFGIKTGNTITLDNISKDLRSIPPHPDDILYRPNILPPSDPDNYIIGNNSVDINLGQSLSFDILQFSFWGIVNLSVRTTQIVGSGQTLNQNLFRKWYVTNNVSDPDNPNSGTAYIYYSIKSIDMNFFESKSFSLPLFITYPVLYIGREKDVIVKVLGGTNALLPNKIEFESEKGWYRYGEYEIQDSGKQSIGELKETDWFCGVDVEANFNNLWKFNFECTRVYSDYDGNFNVPLTINTQNNVSASFRISVQRMF